MTDVLALLTTDHREALELVTEIRGTADGETRRELADRLISELVRHSVAEETYVYPTMKAHVPDGEKHVEHDVEEHKELERTMKALEAADAATPEFDELMGSLEATLRDHISDEEDEQFPLLREHVPADQLVDLAGKVEQLKAIAPTRPHPASPNNQLFHLLVGPGVGLVDRLRDRLSGRNA